jgi:hypothetical protein
MTTTKVQARGEGDCGRVTDRGKEACECMGQYRVCRLPSVHHCEAQYLSVDQVKDELVQRKPMLLYGEIYTVAGTKSSRRRKARRSEFTGIRKHGDRRFNSPTG